MEHLAAMSVFADEESLGPNVLAIIILSAASLSTAKPAVRTIPVDFDLSTISEARAEQARRRWLPPRIAELPDDSDRPGMFRFRGTKVKLKVPL